MKDHNFSRRRFIGTGMMAAAGLALTSKSSFAKGLFRPAKVDSKINGVQIGVITYSFRSMPSDIDSLLKYCIECNINAVELMGDSAEAYAGAPKYVSGTTDFAKKMADWREGAAMDKFIEIRKMFNDQNINIYAWKPNALGSKNTDGEIEYAFKAGKALGCTHVTVELPEDAAPTQR